MSCFESKRVMYKQNLFLQTGHQPSNSSNLSPHHFPTAGEASRFVQLTQLHPALCPLDTALAGSNKSHVVGNKSLDGHAVTGGEWQRFVIGSGGMSVACRFKLKGNSLVLHKHLYGFIVKKFKIFWL